MDEYKTLAKQLVNKYYCKTCRISTKTDHKNLTNTKGLLSYKQNRTKEIKI